MLVRKENKIVRKETLSFGSTSGEYTASRNWYRLLRDCVNVDSESEAKEFFKDVEYLARELDIWVEGKHTVKRFSAIEALRNWKIVEKKVEKWIEDLIHQNGEAVEDLPSIGLVYRDIDDRLVLGIHDGVGGFDEMSAWEFVNEK